MREKRKKELKMKKEKIINLIKKFFWIFILLCIIYNIIFVIYTTISKKEYMQLFGITMLCMKTDAMQNDIEKNDLIIIKKIDAQELKKEDIIAYQINEKIRVNKIIDNQNNEFKTKSNKNYNPDIEKINDEQIIGKKVFSIPHLGMVLRMLQSKIITVIMLLFLIINLVYNKYIQEKKKERVRKKLLINK